MNKSADLYSQCVDILDNVQSTVLEILEAGHGLDKDRWYILKMAMDIVRDYESLSPEVKHAMEEINDSITAGKMTLEEALDMVTSIEPEKKVLDNKNKRLLN